jgi:hypothetical protein
MLLYLPYHKICRGDRKAPPAPDKHAFVFYNGFIRYASGTEVIRPDCCSVPWVFLVTRCSAVGDSAARTTVFSRPWMGWGRAWT